MRNALASWRKKGLLEEAAGECQVRAALFQTLMAAATSTVLVAAVLIALLAAANPRFSTPWAYLELTVAMLWLSGVVHLVMVFGLWISWPIVRRIGRLRGRWTVYLTSGLVAGNVTWVLWNRLGMVHQWVSVRPFLTWAGLVQNGLLLLIGSLTIAAGVGWRSGRRGKIAAVFSGLVVIALAFGTLAWNRKAEVAYRSHSLERVHQSVRGAAEGVLDPGSAASSTRPVIVLAVDGLSWNVLVPLLEAGKLPNFARWLSEGSVGYLDSGGESLSPRIWNTVFSGRFVEAHGIEGYGAVALPRTGASFSNLLLHRPAIDTLYGLKQLLSRLPNPGRALAANLGELP